MIFKHELVIPNSDLPFRMFLFEGPDGNYRVAKHWHRSVEIFAILEGRLEFWVGSNMYPLTPDKRSIIFVNSNEVHAIDAPVPNHTIVLQIPLKNFKDYLGIDDYISFARANPVMDHQLVGLITDMYHTYEEKKYGYELKVNSQFLMLLYHMVNQYKIAEPDIEVLKQNRNLNRLSDITDYIRKNYNQELSLEAVANRFGFSPAYLSRMFQKYAGINYKTFLQNLRLEYAFQELVGSSHLIGDIALNHGFPNSKAFANAFRKRYGILPGEYRKDLEGMAQNIV